MCNDNSILVLFKKVILKWVGGTGGKIGLNVGKWSFSMGLKQGISLGCP